MKLKHIQIVLFFVLYISTFTFAQGIKINEVSTSNTSIIKDSDGDYPDWIELYNNSSTSINLSNLFISDSGDNLKKWQFPNIELEPDSLMLIFASGKDRTETINHWETVIREGDNCTYLVPQSNPLSEWKSITYDDGTWSVGPTGIGFGDNDDNTTINSTISVFLRCDFRIDDVQQIGDLFLHIDFDDGFVAYLNGEEIARENLGNAGSAISYNTTASDNHEAQMYQGNPPNTYPISDKIDLLQNGENILAIEVHNVSNTSSDLTIIPFLSIGYNRVPNNPQGTLDFLNLKGSNLHTNFKLKSDGELLLLSNINGEIEDSLFTKNQLSDYSLGRFPNGSDNLFFFSLPTPGKKNIDNGGIEFLEPPTFSDERGFYQNSFSLQLSNPNTFGEIRYTLDGSEPEENSTLYNGEISISDITVIRAKAFADGFLSSPTETHTYFVDTEQRLPILSLTTNREHFFDYNTGIYVLGPNAEAADPHRGANFWEDWERPIHLEFFEADHKLGFNLNAGVKIFGQWSRANAQKSLSIFARGRYGTSEIDYQLFPDSEIDKYKSFILRNSGNDWNYSMFRDALIGNIVEPLNIDKQNYRPVVVYFNGEYWGIHNMREKINTNYLSSHYGIPTDDINIIENGMNLVDGETNSYEEFLNRIETLDMTTDEAFDYIDSTIDVAEFIGYFLAEIFIDNRDWPGNNIKYWQQRSTNSKWRWIMYDTDFGFSLYYPGNYTNNTLDFALEANGPNHPNPPWSTFLLRRFVENEKFKNMFISRYSTYSNTLFSPENTNAVITRFADRISSEIPFHTNKWGKSFSRWEEEIVSLRTFADNRLNTLTQYFANEFRLSGKYELSISQNIEKGIVEVTDFVISEDAWEGIYFDNIPVKVTAKPNAGYIFSHWDGDINSTDNPIFITSSQNVNLIPVYSFPDLNQIVINEINYNSADSFNPDDWIELYNYSDHSIDLSGWVFMDEDPTPYFTIPENVIIPSDGYIILCRDTILFKSKFPDVENYFGDFGFGLSGGGELIRLFDSSGLLIDSLTYDDKEPWPKKGNGDGPTLELKNPNLDNSKYYNWKASEGYGSPSTINSVYTSIEKEEKILPKEFQLFQNYPNPFNPSTTIKYAIPLDGNVKIKIYDILGKEVLSLLSEFKKAGIYNIKFNSDNLTSGIYFYKIISGNYSATKKMLLLK